MGFTDKRLGLVPRKEALLWRHVVGLVTLALQLNDELSDFLEGLSIL